MRKMEGTYIYQVKNVYFFKSNGASECGLGNVNICMYVCYIVLREIYVSTHTYAHWI